jgi:DNA-binding NarL/FixJ family response regulator
MDLMLPDLSGVDVTRRILGLLPRTRVVILSVCHTCEHIFCALRAGACGYVLKVSAGADRQTLPIIVRSRKCKTSWSSRVALGG